MKNKLFIFALMTALLMLVFGSAIFSATYDKTYTDYMMAIGHLDMGWTWDWPTTLTDLQNELNTQFTNLTNNADYKWTMTSMQYFKWLKEYDPAKFNTCMTYINNGRMEVNGGQWVEPDANLVSGESQARQFLVGKLYARSVLGVDPKMAFLPDTFGHPWTLPQILKKSGMDFFVETKVDGNSTLKPPYICNWTAPDGTSILTNNCFMYGGGMGDTTYANATMDRASALGLKNAFRTFGAGDQGGGPTAADITTLHNDNNAAGCPAVKSSTMQEYYNKLLTENLSGIPTWNDELFLTSRYGYFSNDPGQKYLLRKNDVKVLETEKFNYIASWLGATSYLRDKLKEAWEIILINGFHDHVHGTWCTNSLTDRVIDIYGASLNLLNKTCDYTVDAISGRADTTASTGNIPLVVFNSLSWARSETVETSVTFTSAPPSVRVYDDTGAEVPTQVISINGNTAKIIFEANNIPSVGFKVFKAVATSAGSYSTGLSVGSNIIQNNYIKTTINATTGNFSSVYLKGSSWEAIKSGSQANELHYLADTANARDLNQTEMEATPTLLNSPSSITVVESGPVRAIYRITKATPAGSAITQDVIMYSNVDRVDIKTGVNWNEQHKMLKVSFPFNLSPTKCTYEIPYGNIDRPVTRNTTEEKAKFEVPGLQWADMSASGYGVSILNDSKYGWDALNNRLRLSLYRSPNANDTRYEVGHYDNVYSIYPHSGDWKSAGTVREANQLNCPLVAWPTTQHSGVLGKSFSFVSVDQPNVMVTALKNVEDSASNDMIIRLVEVNGVTSTTANVTFPGTITAASKVNLIEDYQSAATYNGNTLTSTIGNYGIQSFRLTISSPNYSNTKPAFTKVALGSYYNVNGISTNGARANGVLDTTNHSYPAEIMPSKILSEDIEFDIGPADTSNIIKCAGQTITLPQGNYNNLYLLAVACSGSNPEVGTFAVNYTDGSNTTQALGVHDWASKNIVWVGSTANTGQPIHTDNIAYIITHRHNATGDDVAKYIYIYKYAIALNNAKTVNTLVLPNIANIKVLAVTLANTSSSGAPTPTPMITPTLTPVPTPTPTATPTPGSPIKVSLTASFNQDVFSYDSNRADGNYDGAGASYPAEQTTVNPTFESVQYQLGPLTDGSNNGIKGTGQVINLPQGQYSSIRFLGAATNGNQTGTFRITYTDNSYTDVSKTQLDWRTTSSVSGEKVVETMTHKHTASGDSTARSTYIFGYYLTPTAGKTVKSLTLPNNGNMHVLAITLVP